MGLTLTGLYALTRAVRFSTEPARGGNNPAAPALHSRRGSTSRSLRSSHWLVPEVHEALGNCPEHVRWLNRDAPGPLSLLVREPGATVLALAEGLVWLSKPMVYPSFLLDLGTWGEGRVHRWLMLREPGPAPCRDDCRPHAQRLSRPCGFRRHLRVHSFAGVIVVGAFAMFVDAIEQARHASAFNVMSLTTLMLLIPNSSAFREGWEAA